ncbi:aspartic peptidase domain-containing protein [Crepidotus variabilis]|uniref:Aspartic peptidase domain-containing protein n=1 Tax=Crepidotus variabilis TaxID=179855 RepID=A0A9P6EI01_9AGAR|nr:aspartic peptidase domain-containing protein [Crepidotus variabilis]
MAPWILLFAFVAQTLASQQLLLTSDQISFALPLDRSKYHQHFVQNTSHIFDPSHAKAELAKIVTKYRRAPDFFGKLHLKPSLDDVSKSDSVSPPVSPVFSTMKFAQVPLTDFIVGGTDVMYTGPVNIGTPPQVIPMDIDTGSADLWAMADCTQCTSTAKQFDKKASSTYAESQDNPFSVTYGTGSISAYRATDIVTLQGLSIANQSFGAVMKATDDFDDFPAMSGIMGMAFSSIAQSGQPTLFENLMNSGKTGKTFAVHLERQKQQGSELCLGCYNPAKMKGSITWLPVISQTYWTLALGGFSVDQKLVSVSGVNAAIDTGTTYIYIPRKLAESFYAQIPESREATEIGQGFFTFPCKSTSVIALAFGSNNFAISNEDFNLGPVSSNSSDCVGGILAMGEGFPDNLAIVGDEFLKNWYSLYDYSNGVRVGFAPSINNI